MKNLKKSLLLSLVAAVMTLYPVTSLAEDAQPVDTTPSSAVTTPSADTNSSTPPADPAPTPAVVDPAPAPVPAPAPAPVAPAVTTPGPTSPTGADAKKYVYNPATGKYESEFYIWDPVTKQTSPKVAPKYSYNPATGMWDTTKWVYDAPSGKYVANVVETPVTPPASQQVAPASAAAGINNTGPDSNNQINNNTTNNGTFNLFYNAAISNNITQNATSGNALLTGNTTAGNATTGNADNIANVINMLQSSWSPLASGNLTTFTGTISGDVHGDLMIDPSSIGNTGPNSNNGINGTTQNNLTVNAEGNGTINNNIAVNSQSGNAEVSGNTTGGNATTGNATAMVNLINAINSSIAAGKSFLGMINITGNLDGDILLPPDVLNALIASTGPDSNNQINSGTTNNVNANLTDNTAINNNINSNATTGGATVAGNTTGGNATSGNALNNVNILNLTGKQVVGKDAMLVFVNVLGKWTGLIMNAPAGSTAAALGGGITSTGPDSNNFIDGNASNNVDINATNNNTINNNIDVNATSGDAVVTHNTTGGNATSGDAKTAVNIANISGSNLSFSDWFGVLFINVFGSWNGSFGVNTSAGDKPATVTQTTSTTSTAAPAAVLKFVSKANTGTQKVAYAAVSTPTTTTPEAQKTAPAVLGNNNTPAAPQAAPAPSTQLNLMWVPFVGSGMGLLILLVEEIIRRRNALKGAGTIATV